MQQKLSDKQARRYCPHDAKTVFGVCPCGCRNYGRPSNEAADCRRERCVSNGYGSAADVLGCVCGIVHTKSKLQVNRLCWQPREEAAPGALDPQRASFTRLGAGGVPRLMSAAEGTRVSNLSHKSFWTRRVVQKIARGNMPAAVDGRFLPFVGFSSLRDEYWASITLSLFHSSNREQYDEESAICYHCAGCRV